MSEKKLDPALCERLRRLSVELANIDLEDKANALQRQLKVAEYNSTLNALRKKHELAESARLDLENYRVLED